MAYFQRKSTNKYNAKGRRYNGQWFDSTGEMNYAQELDWRIKAKDIQSYTRQHKIDLRVNGVHITNYFCDFRVINKHGGIEFHEYKGLSTEPFQIKWRLLQALLKEIEPDGAEMILIKHR